MSPGSGPEDAAAVSSPALAAAKSAAQPLGPAATAYDSQPPFTAKLLFNRLKLTICFPSVPGQEKRFPRPEAPTPKATPRTVGQVAGNPPPSTQSSSSSRPQAAPTSTPATASAAASAAASTPAPAAATLPNPAQVRFWICWAAFEQLLSPVM